ncbi:MAG: 30S ribosomal protein S20 [Phycisphaerales bacterium]
MAHTLSAKKRIRQTERRRALNRWRKRRIHTAITAFERALNRGTTDEASEALRNAESVLDKVARTGAIHRNKAARKKSRLARRLNAAKAKSSN